MDIEDKEIYNISEKLNIEKEMLNRLPSALSGGQAQRISIIRSFIHNPEIILADEPTSSLHHDLGIEVMKTLGDWCHGNEKRSLIWVTHNVEQAASLADYLIFLRDGKIVRTMPNPGDPDSILKILRAETGDKHEISLSESETVPPPKQTKPVECLPETEHDFSRKIQERKPLPWLNMMRFIFLFALSDIFPKSNNTKPFSLFQKLFKRRNSQSLNMMTLFTVVLFGLFFINISYSLKYYFVTSMSDPRINMILVKGKKRGTVLKKEDMDKLSTLVWARKSTAFTPFITWKEKMEKEGYVYVGKATHGAYGSRDRGFNCYLSKKLRGSSYSSTYSLDVIVLNVKDPILNKDFLYEGTDLNNIQISQKTIQSLFLISSESEKNSEQREFLTEKEGIIITLNALTEDLGYSHMPEYIEVDFNSTTYKIPVLGVVESLPFAGDMMVAEGWYEKHFREIGSKFDPLPGYERISVYINDMIQDGIPMCDAIKEFGYITSEGVKKRLEWIKNLTDFVMLFSVIASIGVLLIACGTLFSSYAQAVRQKQKEIGVLVAKGIGRIYLYIIFFVELIIVLTIATVFVFFAYQILNLLLKFYMTHKLNLGEGWEHIFLMPGYVWPTVLGVTIGMAGLSVVIAVRQIIKFNPATILKRTQ